AINATFYHAVKEQVAAGVVQANVHTQLAAVQFVVGVEVDIARVELITHVFPQLQPAEAHQPDDAATFAMAVVDFTAFNAAGIGDIDVAAGCFRERNRHRNIKTAGERRERSSGVDLIDAEVPAADRFAAAQRVRQGNIGPGFPRVSQVFSIQ